MAGTLKTKTGPRTAAARRAVPSERGQPDPRPLTEYTVAVSVVGGSTRVTVALDQPCVVRSPNWAFIDAADGARIYAPSVVVLDNRSFYFQFLGVLGSSVGFIEAPYQDMQVQNFQGGFVRPGGQWFRKAV